MRTLLKKQIIAILVLAVLCLFSVALAAGSYHGNIQSGIFHASYCRWYTCKNCVAVFDSRQEAIAAGYRACKVCKP